MADITAYQGGDVDDSGKVNWRGDQTVVAQGGQSVYKTSTVPLADLGSRKVVGDRVFRYARLGAVASAAGDILQMPASAAAFNQLSVTAGATDGSGSYTFTFYSTTARAANYWAEGTLWAQSGTAANLGQIYRIKSHAALAATTNGTLVLYDPLRLAVNVTDLWSVQGNPYNLVTQNTAGTRTSMGVLNIAATTNDYLWIQTWGPCAVKSLTAVGSDGTPVFATGTGACIGYAGTDNQNRQPIGWLMMASTTLSERELVFLTIAP